MRRSLARTCGMTVGAAHAPWQRLYFLPLPHGQGSLRDGASPTTRGGCGANVGSRQLVDPHRGLVDRAPAGGVGLVRAREALGVDRAARRPCARRRSRRAPPRGPTGSGSSCPRTPRSRRRTARRGRAARRCGRGRRAEGLLDEVLQRAEPDRPPLLATWTEGEPNAPGVAADAIEQARQRAPDGAVVVVVGAEQQLVLQAGEHRRRRPVADGSPEVAAGGLDLAAQRRQRDVDVELEQLALAERRRGPRLAAVGDPRQRIARQDEEAQPELVLLRMDVERGRPVQAQLEQRELVVGRGVEQGGGVEAVGGLRGHRAIRLPGDMRFADAFLRRRARDRRRRLPAVVHVRHGAAHGRDGARRARRRPRRSMTARAAGRASPRS